MEWDISLETGNTAVDAQHRRLLEIFNELESTEREHGSDEVRNVLDDLTDYVGVHFAMEERLMHEVGYSAETFEEHVGEHRGLTNRTREMVLAYRSGELDSVAPLLDLLRTWLVDHIGRLDRTLAERVAGFGREAS